MYGPSYKTGTEMVHVAAIDLTPSDLRRIVADDPETGRLGRQQLGHGQPLLDDLAAVVVLPYHLPHWHHPALEIQAVAPSLSGVSPSAFMHQLPLVG
jgi:hypothetical protein